MKPVVLVTDLARAKILDLLNEEEAATPQGLRIEVTGESGPEYRYELSFDALDSAEADDSIVDWLGLGVIVPASSIDKLQGATLDLPAGGSGMVLRNPNRPNPLAGLDVELTGEVPERINLLLEKAINPSLAQHGGYAELRAWEEPKAYILMGGGCQGCAVSAMTLRSGIERTLKDQIPEILEVVDVTDHASGTNPYYEPAKK
ncbi:MULTISPECIES: iron-sulfur cluster biogenesis protein NfuA [Candidatus Microthrix]|jgi:Fe/S biogenesis protein NfuA|uniref:Putative Nitrogen-fixing NifU domain protein n=1 Tax=Candidatus Neomicrothrix parvicella RN1 TaxID=1229780 RepID=R4YX06_9ACTN|nr:MULTISPECIES: iron-sulfur cluster biogenesis protein NfuA [Microthrix]MBP7853694.1 iron-sulfur cluster biogenesis protein NfuA [Candidatus Microthrix sp.]MBP9622048.1 iron-sulfur cluster biogenesis protein NfuA [Candidatus Microthrix sp.]MBP9832908.1 iron-sulfur cluster biogenesis protein NfuA [Candidatus Microthrix sp.]CCM62615.1 putative Nitrogen-fixing NifU domain protein [Candidatus Microthrix parvicella RN1]